MKIDRVTLTGADDSIRPDDLISITERFPFVEWGILVSPKRKGEPRYPSADWTNEFIKLGLPCSAHLCGLAVDRFISGLSVPTAFGRMQLNFNLQAKGHLLLHLPPVVAREKTAGRPIIFQMNESNKPLASLPWVESILFDGSGGRGLSPNEWPKVDPSRYCGYAGGLSPDNLDSQLRLIEDAAGNATVWIDMEGRIRSEDGLQFDLEKAIRCLEIAAPFTSVPSL